MAMKMGEIFAAKEKRARARLIIKSPEGRGCILLIYKFFTLFVKKCEKKLIL